MSKNRINFSLPLALVAVAELRLADGNEFFPVVYFFNRF